MWNAMVLTVMMSVAGYYAMTGQERMMTAEQSQTVNLADDMAVYRQLVVNYFTANPGFTRNAAVPSGDLTVPDWVKPLNIARWSNYIDGDGTIYIFAAAPLPVSITSDIVKLSRNSVLAGEAVAAAGGALHLHAPADMDTQTTPRAIAGRGDLSGLLEATDYGAHAPIALPPDAGIQAGSPVWLASRN